MRSFITSGNLARRRSGFTLLELLVSMTLTIFIMAILAEAFGTAMETYHELRALGEMQDNLRIASNALRFDLSQDHFEAGRKLSDLNFWNEPRREGFFYFQGSPIPAVSTVAPSENSDFLGFKSQRMIDHVLHFSVRQRGNRRENVFAIPGISLRTPPPPANPLSQPRMTPSNLPADTFFGGVGGGVQSDLGITSQWAEVAYFLVPMPAPAPPQATEDASPTGTGLFVPLFRLYRAQLLVLPFTDSVQYPTATINSIIPNNAQNRTTVANRTSNTGSAFLSPNDIARGAGFPAGSNLPPILRRFAPNIPLNGIPQATLLLNNVVSFEVQALQSGTSTPTDLNNMVPGAGDPVIKAFETAPNIPPWLLPPIMKTPYTFVAANPRVLGLQIVIRIYDPDSGLSRQVALMQDM